MSLRGLPSEVVCNILESCGCTRDALALAKSCTHWHDEWMAHRCKVLWTIWKNQISSLDEALVTVRATQIVLDHEARGEKPPTDMDLSKLSEEHQKPSFLELRAVWGMDRVVDIISARVTASAAKHQLEGRNLAEAFVHVRRAVYRMLIAGACMAGVYNAPRYDASPAIDPETFTRTDGPRIQKFFAYQRNTTPEASEAAFGGFATWLRGRILLDKEARLAMATRHTKLWGRGMCCLDNRQRGAGGDAASSSSFFHGTCPLEDVDEATHADTHLVIWETMQMLWVGTKLQNLLFEPRKNGEIPVIVEVVPAILFGEFWPAEFCIVRWPTDEVDGGKRRYTLIRAPPTKKEAPTVALYKGYLNTFRGWASALQWVHDYSGQPNRYVASFAPVNPLAMKLFDFLIQRYARARIIAGFYITGLSDIRDPKLLIENFALFANDAMEGRDPLLRPQWVGITDEFVYGFADGSEVLETDNKPLPAAFFDDNGLDTIFIRRR